MGLLQGGPSQPPWPPGFISSGGGGAGSTAGRGAGVSNAYDKTGNLSSILSREGIDIGPQPDFWADLNQIVSRLRPRATAMPAMQQAQALRAPVSAPSTPERPGLSPVATARYGPAQFATLTSLAGSSPYLQAWRPGMNYGAGNAPVATYSG